MKNLKLDHHFTQNLPADKETSQQQRQVFKACYSWATPKKVSSPKLLIHSPEVAKLIGINTEDCTSDAFTQVFSGNIILPDMKPYAMCYGGHQFGSWAGQLGDGRAINLGDIINPQGKRWALQLKGAGPTPYSRTADGLAVLRSSIREFLCSEAMFHLGVPTTRALSLCTTGDKVLRDMFYDGNSHDEQGAVVCRVAPSFLRFGSFEIFSARNDLKTLQALLDFTIQTHFQHLIKGKIDNNTYLAWFSEVCELTKDLMVHWQRVGFVHGVMNTDNMSILGLSIDYGPYGWLEDYNPDWTPNTTDTQYHRYSYGKQASIAHWNLMKLGQAIAPLLQSIQPLQETLDHYATSYQQAWQTMMANKLGLKAFHQQLIEQLLHTLELTTTDMTIFFRALANISPQKDAQQCLAIISPAFYHPLSDEHQRIWLSWLASYLQHINSDGYSHRQRQHIMNATNPKYVLRNYLAQLAIDQAEQGDLSMLRELFEVLRNPYDEQTHKESVFAQKRPQWAEHRAGCSMLSCSS